MGESDGIEGAWQMAEAELPDWWAIRSLIRIGDDWEAVAYEGNQIRLGRGPTPKAALNNLASRFIVAAQEAT